MKKLSFRHGKLIVAAVAQIIWSSLDDTSTYVPVTDPRMPTVMHFDANGEADAFLVGLPASIVLQSLSNRAGRDPRR